MSPQTKQLSNSFSTGGGGINFETRVQAAFIVLMLTGGLAPCLPSWPIRKIKFQGKYAGYDTDDLIVFVKDSSGDREAKLLVQIKHSIKITKNDKTFGEVIQAAWNDFNNPDVFTFGTDVFALITGPLSTTDTNDVRTVLEWARHSEDASDFLTMVNKALFSSNQKRSKLKAFQNHLEKANGTDVSDNQLWKFMKSFHLLGYDLDIKAGVTLSLLHSLIGQYSLEDAQKLWSRIVDEVQSTNQNAGTLDIETISQDIRDSFKERTILKIPEDFVKKTDIEIDTDWIEHAEELAIAELLGAWNEASEDDKKIVEKLSGSTYAEWIGKMRDILLSPQSPLIQKNGIWDVAKRREGWDALGPRLFDEHLERLKEVAVGVLREHDPKFDLPPDERYAASIHGKVLVHSRFLRNGLAESLALLGSHPKALTSCSFSKAETTAVIAVRKILDNADWVLWASLNDLLPLLAEAAPEEFLNAVETALNSDSCPFDNVFAQEGAGSMSGNYITGLLWALETLAWDADYLTRVVILLGEFAVRDPGGNWTNRPANSLTTILLPWLPQTCASVARRKTAVETLNRELPNVAWKLLLSLLPESHQTSFYSRKPAWREMIDDGWSEGVTVHEYWEQIAIYAELVINAAKSDFAKLADLIDHLDDLPPPAYEQIMVHLESEVVASMPEEGRLQLWTELVDLVSKHRKFMDAQWAMKPEQVDRIAAVAEELAPDAPEFLYRRLFSERDFDLYEEKGDYKKQRDELEKYRQRAVMEIFDSGGVKGVIEFTKTIQSPWHVGIAFGMVSENNTDRDILPELLETENKSLAQFTGGFVGRRFRALGWQWIDEIDTSQWTPTQLGQLLAYLPFTPATWGRSALLLGEDESSYWTKTTANPYEAKNDIGLAVDYLVKHGRPHAAIRCLRIMRHENQPLDSQQVVQALLAALDSSESTHMMDIYDIVEVIKVLQNDQRTNPDDLFKIEWAYLPLLNQHQDASPMLLEQRLVDEPSFFCEVIQTIYRSDNEKEEHIEEPTEKQKSIATNAYSLLREWKTPPGSQKNGAFNGDALTTWLAYVKAACVKSGHLEIALSKVGQVLIHTPPDPDGLWLHRSAATALNDRDANNMRDGFRIELFNSRGAHVVDPEGREERDLAEKYHTQAEEVEACGYYRLSSTLRDLAASYERDAERDASQDSFDDQGW